MSQPVESRDAEENHRRIVQLKEEAMRSFILLGKELKLNKDKRYFESLGHLTFETYIESPMVSLGRRSVYSLIAIYETFVEKLGYSLEELSEVDYSKLDRIIPAINVQSIAHREWFERAKTLSQRELEREVREARENHTKRMPKPSAPELPDNGLQDWLNTVQCGDSLELLRQLPDECIDMVLTSPPYYGLRDYGVEGQLGLEPTLGEFLEKMLVITVELKRVLKKTGTLWWNHGDSYSGSSNGEGITDKCLLMQNHRLVIKMCDEQEWILRNVIIWHKPNCMPSSVEDRFTVDYEPVFLFSKSEKYYFERQFEPHLTNLPVVEKGTRGHGTVRDKDTKDPFGSLGYGEHGRNKRSVWRIPTQPFPEAHFAVFPEALCETPIKAGCPSFVCRHCGKGREKIFSKEYTSSAGRPPPFAPQQGKKYTDGKEVSLRYPVRYEVAYTPNGYTTCPCNAGFEGGIVLDPFCGSGTALVVASKLRRRYLGFEINPDYVEMARKRLQSA